MRISISLRYQILRQIVVILSVLSVHISEAAIVAHWSFDESGGTVVHDSIGGNNGTLSSTGARLVNGGISGKALQLSHAENGFVIVSNIFPFLSGDFSLVAWVKMTEGIPYDNSMFVAKHETYTRNGYYLSTWSTTGKALMAAGDYIYPNAAYSTTDVTDGQWHQVVGVYRSGVQQSLYVDGAPVEGTALTPGINPNNAPVMLGGCLVNGVPSNKFTGLIDEVQVYDSALSDSDVDYLYQNPTNVVVDCAQTAALLQDQLNSVNETNLLLQSQVDLLLSSNALLQAELAAINGPAPAGLLAQWHFDEDGGTTVRDAAGSYAGTLSASGASFVSGGISGKALSLDPTANGYVTFGNVLPFTNGDFSFVIWIKMRSGDTTLDNEFLSKHEAFYQNGYLMTVNSTGNAPLNKALFYDGGYFGSGVDQAVSSKTSVNDGRWHQVVAVHVSGGRKFIYVDGVPAEASNDSQPVEDSPAPFMLGGESRNGVLTGMFRGLIDEVQIYGRALAVNEVNDLYRHPAKALVANSERAALMQRQLNSANGQIALLKSTCQRLQGQVKNANVAIANLRSQLARSNRTISDLQTAVASAKVVISILQNDLNAAAAMIGALQGKWQFANASLRTLVSDSNASVVSQIDGSVDHLTGLLRDLSKNPSFVIPGATLDRQISNIVSAVEGLSDTERQAIYLHLLNKGAAKP